MQITGIHFRMMSGEDTRLRAICSVVFDHDFVVHDLKVIDSQRNSGRQFVAMPTRRNTDDCPFCCCQNHLRARFCNACGIRLADNRFVVSGGYNNLFYDVAHPTNPNMRATLEDFILPAFAQHLAYLNSISGSMMS